MEVEVNLCSNLILKGKRSALLTRSNVLLCSSISCAYSCIFTEKNKHVQATVIVYTVRLGVYSTSKIRVNHIFFFSLRQPDICASTNLCSKHKPFHQTKFKINIKEQKAIKENMGIYDITYLEIRAAVEQGIPGINNHYNLQKKKIINHRVQI